jgi:hypothetical protein
MRGYVPGDRKMRQLLIEYVFEGHKRGYNFTSPTNGFNDDTLKLVWRSAMPRGQGWGADIYLGARSLKSFHLPDGRVALAESIVTGLRDESNRGGIRRTQIQIMQSGEYSENLASRLEEYPVHVKTDITRKPRFGERRKVPRIKGDDQIILSCPYQNTVSWQSVEALILKTALEELNKRWTQGKIISFTTLALDFRNESQVVVMPETRVTELGIKSYPLGDRF